MAKHLRNKSDWNDRQYRKRKEVTKIETCLRFAANRRCSKGLQNRVPKTCPACKNEQHAKKGEQCKHSITPGGRIPDEPLILLRILIPTCVNLLLADTKSVKVDYRGAPKDRVGQRYRGGWGQVNAASVVARGNPQTWLAEF